MTVFRGQALVTREIEIPAGFGPTNERRRLEPSTVDSLHRIARGQRHRTRPNATVSQRHRY